MSSTYRILCLSHDPAIVLDAEWHSSQNGRTAAEAVAANPEQHEATRHHAGCDLVIGCYSYPLVEVGCPASKKPGGGVYHPHSAEWVNAMWLRLLWHAQQADPHSALGQVAAAIRGCWTPERLNRLRHELHCE